MTEILIKINVPDRDYDYDEGIAHETVATVTLEQLIKEKNELFFNQFGYVKVQPDANGQVDQKTAELLGKHGWIHSSTAKSREEKKLFENKYYLYDPINYFERLRSVDVDNLTIQQLESLAKEQSILLQEIIPKSVLTTIQYKRLQTQIAKIKKAKATAAKAAETRKKKNQEKKIAAAKKLLKEAGAL